MRCPTTASNGIPGNAARAKLALTTARDGARASSRASNVRPASTGISSAAKTSPLTVRCWMLNPSLAAHRCPGAGAAEDGGIPAVIASGGRKKGDPARCGHTGDRPKTAGQLLLKGGASLRIVPDARKVHVEREDAVDAEPEVHLLQADGSSPAARRRRPAASARARAARPPGRCEAVPARACPWQSAIADEAPGRERCGRNAAPARRRRRRR